MRKLGIFLFMLSVAAGVHAQEKTSLMSKLAQKNILNHMDVGVNVGTLGVGIDVAVPVGDYFRVRAGYNYMPSFTIHSDFSVETSNGGSIQKFFDKKDKIDEYLTQYNIDINAPEFAKYKGYLDKINNGDVELKDYVSMGMKPHLHQFKFLVDVMPFKKDKRWSFTVGFFAGPGNVANAFNLEKESSLLEAVTGYNDFYTDYFSSGRNLAGHGEVDKITSLLIENGIAGFRLGQFNDGDIAIMVPGEGGTARAEMRVNKVRPYIGFGFNSSLSRNKKWNLNVDAGVLILGKPRVYVDNVYKINTSLIDPDNECYDIIRPNAEWTAFVIDEPLQHVDLIHDLYGIDGKVGKMARLASKFKAYPNISVTLTYRLY